MSTIRSILPDKINRPMMYVIGNLQCRLQYYIDNQFTASQISERIYVGDLASASNKLAMHKNQITHVLCVLNGAYRIYADDFVYHVIHLNDDPWVSIGDWFEQSNQFIDTAMRDGKSLMIHCQHGISRSVTLLVAYYLYQHNKSYGIELDMIDQLIGQLIDMVKMSREIAEPNHGFVEELRAYARTLHWNGIMVSD
jgi:hypothetical protein